jgi:hypothetical protein
MTGTPPPLGPDGWLDAPALEEQLRQSPLTSKRHALIQRIMTTLAAPPDARPRELRLWLDGTVESLSQITTGPAVGGAAPAASPPAAPVVDDRSVLPTVVPAGPVPPGSMGTPGMLRYADGWVGRATADVAQLVNSPQRPRREGRYRALLAIATAVVLLGGGTRLTAWSISGSPERSVAGSEQTADGSSASTGGGSQQGEIPVAGQQASSAGLATANGGPSPVGTSDGRRAPPTVHENPPAPPPAVHENAPAAICASCWSRCALSRSGSPTTPPA